MAVRISRLLADHLDALRCEPTSRWLRAKRRDQLVADTTRAMLVWEPKRLLPFYAVPADDLRCEVVGRESYGGAADARAKLGASGLGAFGLHTVDGEAVTLRVGDETLERVGFWFADADLEGYVLLDFDAFDWLEEDTPVHGHAPDPFHRIDFRRSSRNVRIEIDGETVADSADPFMVYETRMPTRFYLPRTDVRTDLLRPSTRTSVCTYKGQASYWSVALGDRVVRDVVWSYEHPLPEAAEIEGRLCFFDERVDVYVDGVRRERSRTPWSK